MICQPPPQELKQASQRPQQVQDRGSGPRSNGAMAVEHDKVRRRRARTSARAHAHRCTRCTRRACIPAPSRSDLTPPRLPRPQRIILYPAYINSKRTVSQGRRIPADKGAHGRQHALQRSGAAFSQRQHAQWRHVRQQQAQHAAAAPAAQHLELRHAACSGASAAPGRSPLWLTAWTHHHA